MVDNRLSKYDFPLKIVRTDFLMRGKEGRVWEMHGELTRLEVEPFSSVSAPEHLFCLIHCLHAENTE